jgi:catechol 2,3-dioxygenase-like lactoylglutathione lyase family enzyme
MSIALDAIGIVVKDLGVSLKFYRELGLDIPELDLSEPHVEVTLPNGLRFMWDTVELIKGLAPDWVEPVGQRVGLAFLCGSPSEVDSKFASLTAAGYEGRMEPFDAFWGQRYAIVADPDGNGVDLFAPL